MPTKCQGSHRTTPQPCSVLPSREGIPVSYASRQAYKSGAAGARAEQGARQPLPPSTQDSTFHLTSLLFFRGLRATSRKFGPAFVFFLTWFDEGLCGHPSRSAARISLKAKMLPCRSHSGQG